MCLRVALTASLLLGAGALGGCATVPFSDGSLTLSNAASMRVEVEVYKGPLSKTLPVQWGELEGLVDTSLESLQSYAAVICRTIDTEYLQASEKCFDGRTAQMGMSWCDGDRQVPRESRGYQILWKMHADARCLAENVKVLQDLVRQHKAGPLGHHVRQSLNSIDHDAVARLAAVRDAARAVTESVSRAQDAALDLNKELDDTEETPGNLRSQLQAVVDVVGAVTESAKKVEEVTQDLSSKVKAAEGTTGTGESDLQGVHDAAHAVVNSVVTAQSAAQDLSSQAKAPEETLGNLGSDLQPVRDAADTLAATARKVEEAAQDLSNKVNAAEETLGNLGSDLQPVRDAADTLAATARKVEEAAQDLSNKVNAAEETLGNLGSDLQPVRDAADTLAATARKVEEAAQDLSNTMNAAKETLGSLGSRLQPVRDAADTFAESAEKVETAAQDLSNKVNAAEETPVNIESDLQPVRDAADTFAESVEKVETVAQDLSNKVNAAEETPVNIESDFQPVRDAADTFAESVEKVETVAQDLSNKMNAAEETLGSLGSALRAVRDAAAEFAESAKKSHAVAETSRTKQAKLLDDMIDRFATQLARARIEAGIVAEHEDKVRVAAKLTVAEVKKARRKTVAAMKDVIPLQRFNNAKVATEALDEMLLQTVQLVEEVGKAVANIEGSARQIAEPDAGVSDLTEVLVEIEGAIRGTRSLVEMATQAESEHEEALQDWLAALRKVDAPSKERIVGEAQALKSRILASSSLLSSVTADFDSIESDLVAIRVKPPSAFPLHSLRKHLADARNDGLGLKDANLGNPAREMLAALSEASGQLKDILSNGNESKAVRLAAGLEEGGTNLLPDIAQLIETRHVDARTLRDFKLDELDSVLASLIAAMKAADELEKAGAQPALTPLIIELGRVTDRAKRWQPNPDEAAVAKYVQALERSARRLPATGIDEARIVLDRTVKDNHEALLALRRAMDDAAAHLRAVVGDPPVPSPEARAQLLANLRGLADKANKPTLKPFSEVASDSTRWKAAGWARRMGNAKDGLDRDQAGLAEVRGEVNLVEGKLALLAPAPKDREILLTDALSSLETAHAAADTLISEDKEKKLTTLEAAAVRDLVVKYVGDVAASLKAKAFFWAETHAALAPRSRNVRIAMAGFANLASELSNQLESRADALQWQLDEDIGVNATELPLSLYLRDAEPTDFLNLYSWNRATAPALLEDMFWHPFNAFSSNETADRVRVIERLSADHNWGKVNTVYGSGQGVFAMALVKDEIGNWSLKSFESDPTKLVEAYTDLTLTAVRKTRKAITRSSPPPEDLLRFTSNLTRGRISGDAGPFDVFDTERLHARVVADLETIKVAANERESNLVKRREELDLRTQALGATAQIAKDDAGAVESVAAPSTCAADNPCLVEDTNRRVEDARIKAYEVRAAVHDLKERIAADAVREAIALAGRAVEHARVAKSKADSVDANSTSAEQAVADGTTEADSPTVNGQAAVDGAREEARLFAERAEAYAKAAASWGELARALVERQGVATEFEKHRSEVNEEIRDVLDDYRAVIATLLESRTPSRAPTTDASLRAEPSG